MSVDYILPRLLYCMYPVLSCLGVFLFSVLFRLKDDLRDVFLL